MDHYVRYRVGPPHYLYVAHALTRAVRDIAGWGCSSRLSSAWVSVCKWVTDECAPVPYFAMQTPAPDDAETHTVQLTAIVPDPRTPSKNGESARPVRRNSGLHRFGRQVH